MFLSALRETPEGSRNVVDGVIDGALRFDLWEVLLNNVAFRYDLAGGQEVEDDGEEHGNYGEPLGLVSLPPGKETVY